MRRAIAKWTTLAGAIGFAAAANAATVTVYTDKSAWEAAVGVPHETETFADESLEPGVSFFSTESGHVNPALEVYQDVLASQSQNEPMTTWTFTPQITAFGGNWTLGGPGGSGNSLLVYIEDTQTLVGIIPNSYGGEFWGFISDSPLSAVTLVGGTGTNQQTYTLDDLVYTRLPTPSCIGDINGDGSTNAADFVILAGNFGASVRPNTGGDLNGDGLVNAADFTILAGDFGCSPP